MPDVSIITPVYNCEKYIRESLDSICNQIRFNSFEWLILNDGSTDSTWDIVCSYNFPCFIGSRIRLIDDNENIKIPKRRNKAVDLAKGKYIAIHDGDDASLPHRLALQHEFLESNADVFCVGGHALKMDLEGEPLGYMDYPKFTHAQLVGQLLRCVNPMIDPTTMFRRKDFLDLGGYTTRDEIYTVPDMDLWCRAIIAGKKMANINKALIRYRTNPDGMTVKHKEEMIKAHMIVWREFRSGMKMPAPNKKEVKNEEMDSRRTDVSIRSKKKWTRLGFYRKIDEKKS